jgi:predicted dehydrogenase
MRRLHAVNRYVFSLVHGRQFGSLKNISYIEGGEFSWPSVSGFYFNPPDRRGILSDRGSHILDLICWWMGEKPRLVSALDDSLGGVEGVCEVRLQGSSVEAFVKINWHNKMKNRVEVMFEHAKVEFEVYEYRRCLVTDLGTGAKRTVLAPGWKLDPATQLLGDLLTDGEDGREPAVSGADVLPSLELIDEYYLMRRPLPMEWMKGLQP